ncbi:MAG: hypothetical protein U1E19_11215 [Rhodoblastus sp.]
MATAADAKFFDGEQRRDRTPPRHRKQNHGPQRQGEIGLEAERDATAEAGEDLQPDKARAAFARDAFGGDRRHRVERLRSPRAIGLERRAVEREAFIRSRQHGRCERQEGDQREMFAARQKAKPLQTAGSTRQHCAQRRTLRAMRPARAKWAPQSSSDRKVKRKVSTTVQNSADRPVARASRTAGI